MNYRILVNTTDSFEDCWLPFFQLFKRYWPTYNGEIYLNTELKEFSYDGLKINVIKNGLIRGSWSQCLKRALENIESETILYMQEDYFLRGMVDTELLNFFCNKFLEFDLDCLYLTDQSTPGPFIKTDDDTIVEIDKNAPYRVSCQAALWKKDILLSLLRVHENAWQFEHYGTKRTRKRNDKFYAINPVRYGVGKKEILPYLFTGIIKGKWNIEIRKLFEENNIKINLIERGFYNSAEKQNIIKKKLEQLNFIKIKSRLYSLIDLLLIKNKSKLKNRLTQNIPLLLNDFNPLIEIIDGEVREVNPEKLLQLNFEFIKAQKWYEKFRDIVFESIGNKYLPIYRMADGEFWFTTRYLNKMNIKQNIRTFLKGKSNFSTIWNEQYSYDEKEIVKNIYISSLKNVSKNGILAVHFIKNSYENLMDELWEWFDKNDIILNTKNYFPFYFVYALLSGKDKIYLIEKKNILIITNLNQAKQNKINNRFIEMGCKSVQFYNISANKAMLEKIDLSKLKMPIDLVLIGAGIGSISILNQLKALNTVCIDAGIVLEVYTNPELATSRIFLQSSR